MADKSPKPTRGRHVSHRTGSVGDITEAKFKIEIQEQTKDELVEQLKHEILLLEEWKKEVGLVAIDTVQNLNIEIEKLQQTNEALKIEIDSLQTQNEASNAQMQTYQEEIDKLQREKPKMESQIKQFNQLLKEQYLLSQSIANKDNEIIELKHDYDELKTSVTGAKSEIKVLRTENDEIKKENEQYQMLLDKLKEQEIKLKKQVNDQQNDIKSLKTKYDDIKNELHEETITNRNTQHIVNNLSDQLHEFRQFQTPNIIETHSRPLLEKRRTLRIHNVSSNNNNSLKLPVMHENALKEQSDDEYIEKCGNQSLSLSPVDEFEDSNDDAAPPANTSDYDEKETMSPILLQTLGLNKNGSINIEDDDEKIKKETIPNLENDIDECSDADIDGNGKEMGYSSDDYIDKILRKVSGTSYNKYCDGNNGAKHFRMDSDLRRKLKCAILKFKDKLKYDYDKKLVQEKGVIISKYKKEAKVWEAKYKKLKKEVKQRNLKNQIKKQQQKINEVQPRVSCRFWQWSMVKNCAPPKQTLTTSQRGETPTRARPRLVVADDTDDSSINSFN